MITNFQYLGIYEDAIDNAIASCEEALRQLEFDVSDIDDMNEKAVANLRNFGDWDDITNSIIRAYFEATIDFINYHRPEIDVDCYINCDDSHLYIGGDEV